MDESWMNLDPLEILQGIQNGSIPARKYIIFICPHIIVDILTTSSIIRGGSEGDMLGCTGPRGGVTSPLGF